MSHRSAGLPLQTVAPLFAIHTSSARNNPLSSGKLPLCPLSVPAPPSTIHSSSPADSRSAEMVKPSKLHADETSYLLEQYPVYRQKSSADKEAFLELCAKHIISARGLNEDDELYLELTCTKVRNWFNNKKETKKGRLPYKIHHKWTGERVFEAIKRDDIRDARNSSSNHDNRLAGWNTTRRKLWCKLSEEQHEEYEETAERWNVEGPDSHLRGILASRRLLGWLRSMAELLWVQCRMVVSIYGGFLNEHGQIMGMRYDTSDLLAEEHARSKQKKGEPAPPLFTKQPGWEKDFRKVFWDFFKSWLVRTDADAGDSNEPADVRARQPPSTFEFDLYDDGTPILVDTENGKPLTYPRRIDIVRQYLRAHYSLARGYKAQSVPWGLIQDHNDQFFTPGMLPANMNMKEPSHMYEKTLGDLITHIIKMETNIDGTQVSRFRFSHYARRKGGNTHYFPAKYDTIITPSSPQPTRSKRTLLFPHLTESGGAPAPQTSGNTASIDIGTRDSRLAVFVIQDQQRAASLEEERRVRAAKASEKQRKANEKKAPKPKKKTRSRRATRSGSTDETDSDTDSDGENIWDGPNGSPQDLRLLEDPGTFSPAIGTKSLISVPIAPANAAASSSSGAAETNTGTSGSIGDVAMQVVVSSKGKGKAVEPPHRRQPSPDLQDPLPLIGIAPCSVESNAAQRFLFLRSLSSRAEYHSMLQRAHRTIYSTPDVKAHPSAPWAVWESVHRHMPAQVHRDRSNLETLTEWLSSGPRLSDPAGEVQRFCLAIGLLLRDIDLVVKIDPEGYAASYLPEYLGHSILHMGMEPEILKICDSMFILPRPRGIGRAAPQASDTMPDALCGTSDAPPAPRAAASEPHAPLEPGETSSGPAAAGLGSSAAFDPCSDSALRSQPAFIGLSSRLPLSVQASPNASPSSSSSAPSEREEEVASDSDVPLVEGYASSAGRASRSTSLSPLSSLAADEEPMMQTDALEGLAVSSPGLELMVVDFEDDDEDADVMAMRPNFKHYRHVVTLLPSWAKPAAASLPPHMAGLLRNPLCRDACSGMEFPSRRSRRRGQYPPGVHLLGGGGEDGPSLVPGVCRRDPLGRPGRAQPQRQTRPNQYALADSGGPTGSRKRASWPSEGGGAWIGRRINLLGETKN
ncbi:hypothetical protein C8Q80DRAFT_1275888 [Daedaleopsis nitida]|nr:hypothetical protein C8Q80DRAFT_1275888 [Daedaleopsis nitida]